MTPRFAADISYYQRVLTDAYPHDFVIFRLCDGTFRDPNVKANLAQAISMRGRGKLVNFAVYVVYRPGQNAAILSALDAVGLPRDCVGMIDVESWGGQIKGDHSAEITALGTAIRARQNGRSDLAWAYANRGDYAAIFPRRPTWMPLVVASYGSKLPAGVGPGPLAGIQYTNGQIAGPAGWPTSSPPFGACDHNVIYLAPLPGASTSTSTEEDDMYTLYQVIPGQPTAGRVYAVRAGSAPIWLSPTDLQRLTRFGLLTNPGAPQGILQVEIDGLAAAIAKGQDGFDDLDASKLDQIFKQLPALSTAAWATNGDATNPSVRAVLAAMPDAIAKSVITALPPASTGGLTTADVETAVRAVFADAAKGN